MSTEKSFKKFCNNREQRNGLVAREPMGVKGRLLILVFLHERFQGLYVA